MGVVSRTVEMRSISDAVALAARGPAGILLEGAAGIGKTTLWLSARQQARDRGRGTGVWFI